MRDSLISVPHLNQKDLYSKWEKFIAGQPLDSNKVFSETYKAWLRCVDYKINPLELRFEKISIEEVNLKKDCLKDVLNLLKPHIQTIKTTVSTHSPNYIITVADHLGYVIEIFSDKQTEKFGTADFKLELGVNFAENRVGNSSIGTVLAIGRPLAVIGAEHYVKALHGWSCVGAPIFNQFGAIIAVLQVSIPCGLENPYTFSLITASAKAVEAVIRQNQMEAQLEETKKSLSLFMQQREIIFNVMSQGVVIINREGVITFFNRAAEEIWGVDTKNVCGKTFISLCSKLCPWKEPLLYRTINEAKSFTNFECKCSNSLQDKFLLVNTSLLRDENDHITGAIGIYTDVTEIRRQETRIREQEKLAVVGQMAAGMAHEIRNPLTAVRGFAQLMSERARKENSFYKDYMDIMIQEIDQADSFINNFLQLARPKLPQMKSCSINELIINFVRIFESQAFLQGIKLKTELQDVPQIIVDQDQIKQVLLNLCHNSLQALKLKGSITLATRYQDGQICIEVIDDGPGIAQDDLAKIGTPFYTTKDNGTGLGLSISYAIVDRHRGRVEVESKIGIGTRFSIYLPVDEQF